RSKASRRLVATAGSSSINRIEVALRSIVPQVYQPGGAARYSLEDAQALIADWGLHNNTQRPHNWLDYRPPVPEAHLPLPLTTTPRLTEQVAQTLGRTTPDNRHSSQVRVLDRSTPGCDLPLTNAADQ
ncbi:MAG: transposase, partial [Chloroflexi bacterium]|nr:transposase [Chloroflexota bacterium]